MYTFREIQEADLEVIRQIYNYYIQNTTVTFHTEKLNIQEVREIVIPKSKQYKSYCILEEERYMGYVLLVPYKTRQAFRKTAEVTIYLTPNILRKGIGTKALAYIEEVAKNQGFHVLLGVICEENKASIHLFKKMGYERCAHYKEVGYKFERWLDLVSYQKIIE